MWNPRSGYILHDRNKYFIDGVSKMFKPFHSQLHDGLKQYRKLGKAPVYKNSLNYLMYITYSSWQGLAINLRKQYEKARVLIISNRHTSHSYMLKDFIEYEFSDSLYIDIFDDFYLSEAILEELNYGFIVANFSLPTLKSKHCVCIENIPTHHDMLKIQHEINSIHLARMK